MNVLMFYKTAAVVTELVPELHKYKSTDKIYVVLDRWRDHMPIWCAEALRLSNITIEVKFLSLAQFFDGYIPDMKFDYIVGNPPYQGNAALHQQIFNMSVEMLKDNCIINFIQPATPYLNKKSKKKSHEADMIENIKRYKTEVEIVSPSRFENAYISTELAITTLTKTEVENESVDKLTYSNGNVYYDINIEDINMLEIEPKIFNSIVSKYFEYIKRDGSLYDISDKNIDDDINAVSIALIRGNRGSTFLKTDYFTFMSGVDFNKTEDIKHGILCEVDENNNVKKYLEGKFARFGLSIYKFNTNVHRGELRSVPLVPFNKLWYDKELYKLINLTDDEIDIIEKYIPIYSYD